jgi:hypothetical protein
MPSDLIGKFYKHLSNLPERYENVKNTYAHLPKI